MIPKLIKMLSELCSRLPLLCALFSPQLTGRVVSEGRLGSSQEKAGHPQRGHGLCVLLLPTGDQRWQGSSCFQELMPI